MNRIVVIFIVFIIGATYIYINKKDVIKGSGEIVYVESRLKLSVADRNIQMVFIGKGMGRGDCENNPMMVDYFQKVCENDRLECVTTSSECKKEINNRYQRMFDKKQAHTHYIYMEDEEEEKAGIFLFWGLTDRESMAFCKSIAGKLRSGKRTATLHTECI